jgi:ATP adenylyltransferase
MTFSQLEIFITSNMRMSHIYQPVMIKCLLENEGKADDIHIAKQLLQFDPSQIEYYQDITNKMVGKVLRSHDVVKKDKTTYYLNGFENLSNKQKNILTELCLDKLEEYIKKRGDAIWQHRKKNRGYISGTIRYEVLKRAEFRCELCGISANEKALEVDHIIPVNFGGEDSINNYQALCYSCNSTKRDRDQTDFRNLHQQYSYRENNCIFCNIEQDRIVGENNLAILVEDKYPVTNLHSLIIPKRHTSDYFSVNQPEINAINQLLVYAKDIISKKDSTISGFNIGFNCGEVSGQTVMHTHMHLIPRRHDDIPDPTGGIRNLLPNMGRY